MRHQMRSPQQERGLYEYFENRKPKTCLSAAQSSFDPIKHETNCASMLSSQHKKTQKKVQQSVAKIDNGLGVIIIIVGVA